MNQQNIIASVFNDFNIIAVPKDVQRGPSVTLYQFQVQRGVKLTRITNLEKNLMLELGVSQLRIVTVPNTNFIGVEVPNEVREVVEFPDQLITANNNAIPLYLGKTMSGDNIVVDLTQMPHLLVAGATGTGKSVCINSLIYAMIAKFSPKELKLIMVDPKMVELISYERIPHLFTPVVTNLNDVSGLFEYLVFEMTHRYELLKQSYSRSITQYNEKAAEKLPYIVLIIDEFADLMTVAGPQIETSIARLAAMSRAVGIHLILATQRPSSVVITGTIKANLPARISFQVASKIDSRIILDRNGAEALTGKGDMLYLGPGVADPIRIQGAIVSDIRLQETLNRLNTVNQVFTDITQGSNRDDLVPKVIEYIMRSGEVNENKICRDLRISRGQVNVILTKLQNLGVTNGKQIAMGAW